MTDPLHTHAVTPSMSWQGPQGECPWCRAAHPTTATRRASPESLAAAKAGNVFATTGAEDRWIADTDAGVYDEDAPALQPVEAPALSERQRVIAAPEAEGGK